MPHPGTHIAALQLLASEASPDGFSFAEALGGTSPEPQNDDPGEAARTLRHRYACLGALGPDLLYFMLDGSADQQGIQTYVMKFFAITRSIEDIKDSISEVWEKFLGAADKVDPCGLIKMVDETGSGLLDTFNMGGALLTSALEGFIAAEGGINLFSLLPSPRQLGKPPEDWYWADHLHYNKTGDFAHNLLTLAFTNPKYKDPAFQAYALGYLSHYIGDVVGHPYVNQIVGGPYRLHRQRHTLTENFIDGWLWTRTHTPHDDDDTINGDKNPKTGRRWLDVVNQGQANCGAVSGSHFYTCRIDEYIDVGDEKSLIPGLEDTLKSFARDFRKGVNAVFDTDGVGVKDDKRFAVWSQMFLDALHLTYDGPATHHPKIIHNDGYPTVDDLQAAYATCLAVMRMQTSSTIEKPEFPDFSGISDAGKKFWTDLKKNMHDALDKIHNPHLGGHFSLSALLDWAKSVVEAAVAVLGALAQALSDLCKLGTSILSEAGALIIYAAQLALYAGYTAVHRVLEVRAYAQPLPETVAKHPELIRNVHNGSLRDYPIMEERESKGLSPNADKPLTVISQDQLFTDLDPLDNPLGSPDAHFEFPTIKQVGQDLPFGSGIMLAGTPLDLLYAPIADTAHPMLTEKGPVPVSDDPATEEQRRYGGIIPNCRVAMEGILKAVQSSNGTAVLPAGMILPNYNLDGDRGLGWQSWLLNPDGGMPLQPKANVNTKLNVTIWGD